MIHARFALPLAAVLSIAAGPSAFAAGHEMKELAPVNIARKGDDRYLVDANKMTLYVFDKDEYRKSNCYGACAEKWPPLIVSDCSEVPRGLQCISREDGTRQIAYKGRPLYLWFKDEKPGDMTGDGVKGVWHVARP